MNATEMKQVAHRMADAAQIETLAYFRGGNLGIANKLDDGFDPVTLADKAAEKAIRAVLAEMRPDDGILGEEYDNVAGTTGLTWVLDPIDGTRGYMSGTPTWGTLIALHDGEKPVMGIIDQPYIGERFFGGFGEAEMVRGGNRRDLKVSNETALGNAVLLSTYPEVGTDIEYKAFRAVSEQCKLTRYGMDCYGYALLAMGQVDLVIEAGLQPYDIQSSIAVIEAAGGIVTDWSGGPCDQGGRAIAAATSELHTAAMEVLSAHV